MFAARRRLAENGYFRLCLSPILGLSVKQPFKPNNEEKEKELKKEKKNEKEKKTQSPASSALNWSETSVGGCVQREKIMLKRKIT